MASLDIAIGACSRAGRKPSNQDFYGARLPPPALRHSKGVAAAIADGISSSDVSQVASETAVTNFLDDYYCTSDAWSAKRAGQRVIAAANSWLYAQTRQSQYRDDADRGYVCTFSAAVFKATALHLFHVGDARVYLLRAGRLERLTEDHRLWLSQSQSYLGRALGVNNQVEIDYRRLDLEPGDLFLLATDGVYEYADLDQLGRLIEDHHSDLDAVAEALVAQAFERGSDDNLTAQLLRVDALPDSRAADLSARLAQLPFPPELAARDVFEGYDIVRELSISGRSRVYLARERDSGQAIALKLPGTDLRADDLLLERFLLEEWIARRIDSPYVLKPAAQRRSQDYIYVAMEYIDGQSLTRWMVDHPRPTLAGVRELVTQIGRGLLAFHRQEMIHQDLRPDNILIDDTGTVKIIDFGAVEVAGINESGERAGADDILGTEQYAAPEYFVGEGGTVRSDLYSLAAIAYQMLTGQLPYGAQVSRARSYSAQNRLRYRSALTYNDQVPVWADAALKKALHPNPRRRYTEVAEFVYDLHHPRKAFMEDRDLPLIERDPTRFWKGLSALLAVAVAGLTVYILRFLHLGGL